nr:hypothetical protein [Tanacetum cinerariifolium]
MQAACDRQKSYADLKLLERIGDVAYKLDLLKELSRVHNTLHVSNLKKCHADEPLAVPLDGLHLDDKFHFVEKPVEIVDREVKRLKRSRIPLFKDYTSAIIPDEPVLSIEEPDNSLSMGDEHLDTIPATESNEVIKSSVENLIPIPNDILREKLLNVNLLIAKIEVLNANPTPSFDCKTKSSSTSLNSLLEETNTFDNSLPEFEAFCFDVEKISSGSTTTHSDIYLPEYEAFYDDHVKEISSGSPTTHSDSSLYASFIFDFLINPFPPADRSDFCEFSDELIPFISPPEYDCFLFKVEPNLGDFIKDVVEDISPTKEPQVHNTLPTHPTLQLNMKFQPSSESLFTYVVWIFLSFRGFAAVLAVLKPKRLKADRARKSHKAPTKSLFDVGSSRISIFTIKTRTRKKMNLRKKKIFKKKKMIWKSTSRKLRMIQAKNPIKHEYETIPASVYEVGESSTAPFLRKDKNVDTGIVAKRARQANVRNNARGSGPVSGQDVIPVVRECTFAGFMKCNPTVFYSTEGAIELKRWFEETKSVFGISECVEGKKVKFAAATLLNELALMCPRMVEMKRVKVDAYIRGLTDNIKGEVTSTNPANLNEANNQKQGNARAMVTAPTDGKASSGSLPLCECYFTRHVGLCTIKCHKCGKIRHKARYCKEKNVATSANGLPILTCYDCGEQGHTRNRCLKKVKQEEVREVRGRAYAIKDAKPKGPNVVTGTFLLDNCYAFVLFDSGFDRSFVDTRFSSMLNIDPVKIGASYEVELADGRVVSTNIVLKGYTLNLVNHIFEIDLMLIELGTFDVIIIMDWLVKHDAVIVCGEKVVRITFGNKILIVEHDKEEIEGEMIGRRALLRASLVARAPHRMAPSEMRELSVQVQELLEKGFIRWSSSP